MRTVLAAVVATVVATNIAAQSASLTQAQTAHPGAAAQTTPKSSSGVATPIQMVNTVQIAPPSNLTYTNSPQVCADHAKGLGGALVCSGIIASAKVLPLVWTWVPCTAAGCVTKIDGYHIYRLQGRFRQLADTQPDQNMTIRGISPFAKTDCFVATAYRGSQESVPSNSWCGDTALPMGISSMQSYPVKTMSITGVFQNSCYPTEKWSIVEGTVSQGNTPARHSNLGTCHPIEGWFGYLGFKIDVHGGVQKALLRTSFTPNCKMAGVVKTRDTRWFAPASSREQMTGMIIPTIKPYDVDYSTERDFVVDSNSANSGAPVSQVSADITPWFSSAEQARTYIIGVSFKSNEAKPGCVAVFGATSIEISYAPSH